MSSFEGRWRALVSRLPSTRALVGTVLTLGLVVTGWAVAQAVSHREAHLAGSNLVPTPTFAAQIPPRGQYCQSPEDVPPDAANLALVLGTYGHPGPPLMIRGTRGGRPVLSGSLSAGWHEGSVIVPIQGPNSFQAAAQVCLRNAGTTPVAVAGFSGRARLEYLTAVGSWWSRLGAINDHFAVGKSRLVGSWTAPATGLLELFALGLAAWLVWRDALPGNEGRGAA